MLDIRHRSQALAVRGQLALDELRARAESGLARRAQALREDGERGAQAVEYAMLGGLSAAACTVVINVINNNQDFFSDLLSIIFGGLGRVARRWF
jgi:Flp pilus assembly pilin Flp